MRGALVAAAGLVGLFLIVSAEDAGREPTGVQAMEVARVRNHLAGAERLMLTRSLDDLTPEQRAARARALDDLRAYAARGIFPHNHVVVGRRSPVFVDEHGTRCAMAYLIERSGDADLVRRIARTHNLARIADLANDPGLVRWLARNGMTVAEAARVQPDYGYVRSNSSSGFKVGQAFAGAFALFGTSLNTRDASSNPSRQARGGVGVMAGLVSITVGVAGVVRQDASDELTFVDLGLGAISLGLGARQLGRVTKPEGWVQVTCSPWIAADGSRGAVLRASF